MLLKPSNRVELRREISRAAADRRALQGWDLSALGSVLAYTPEDMTVTVEAGMTLATLQSVLAQHRQWVPLDPAFAEVRSIERLLSENLSGPRRFGHGTARDHVIGLRAILADGREIHSGGNVVKNVAGYDLHKLFIGARGSLGVIAEVTFKLSPLPEAEAFFEVECPDWTEAERRFEQVWCAPFQLVAFDLHRVERESPITAVLGFAGAREDVENQSAWARANGFRPGAGVGHDARFWSGSNELPVAVNSVLPSDTISTLRQLGPGGWIARAGNGAIYHRSTTPSQAGLLTSQPRSPAVTELGRRIKREFDPHDLLPPIPS